ncbi:MAG: class I SAM-dependent methyltransferase, partial [Candidatus Omnitrophica bacterium]|nr:class I SAM-dependent methyltransferase [Candidatus Omnitrophota bacterium]
NQEEEFQLVQCSNCGHIYTNPTPVDILKFYPKDYNPHTDKFDFIQKAYYVLFRNISGEKGQVLDVGAGNGNFLRFMKEKGWKCSGTEVSEYMVNLCNLSGLDVHKGELCDIKFQTQFDIITFWASLEHMKNPARDLKIARQLLKKGGRLVIWVPNICSLEARLFKKYWHHLEVPTHYSQFRPQTLRYLLEKTGYKVTKIRHDWLTSAFFPSLQYYLKDRGIKVNLARFRLFSFPFDIFCSIIRRSGLITAYAVKSDS